MNSIPSCSSSLHCLYVQSDQRHSSDTAGLVAKSNTGEWVRNQLLDCSRNTCSSQYLLIYERLACYDALPKEHIYVRAFFGEQMLSQPKTKLDASRIRSDVAYTDAALSEAGHKKHQQALAQYRGPLRHDSEVGPRLCTGVTSIMLYAEPRAH
jgi:hypothetical protein